MTPFVVFAGNENSARSFSDRSFFEHPSGHGCPRLRVMDVRTEMLNFPGFRGLDRSFCPQTSAGISAWTSAGYPAPKLTLWAAFSFLTLTPFVVLVPICPCSGPRRGHMVTSRAISGQSGKHPTATGGAKRVVRFFWGGELRGPVAILFISRDTLSDSIAKRFRACFPWVSHMYREICCKTGYRTDMSVVKEGTKEGYRTLLGDCCDG